MLPDHIFCVPGGSIKAATPTRGPLTGCTQGATLNGISHIARISTEGSEWPSRSGTGDRTPSGGRPELPSPHKWAFMETVSTETAPSPVEDLILINFRSPNILLLLQPLHKASLGIIMFSLRAGRTVLCLPSCDRTQPGLLHGALFVIKFIREVSNRGVGWGWLVPSLLPAPCPS